jgi:hypothetical protein
MPVPGPDTLFDYRQPDVDYVFDKIAKAESCSLVGIGSAGKSNLLRTLMQDDTLARGKKKYFPENPPQIILAFLNPHKMIHLQRRALEQAGAAWPGYEMMLNSLLRALVEMDTEGLRDNEHCIVELIAKVENYYRNLFGAAAYFGQAGQQLFLPSHPLLVQTGFRHLEESIYAVFDTARQCRQDWRIVFLFDEVEEFIARLPAQFFQSLRGIRDDFKQCLTFVTASRRSLDEIVDDVAQRKPTPQAQQAFRNGMEGFVELFRGFMRYLGLLDKTSAAALLKRLAQRYDQALTEDAQRELLALTGRHAGLLRRSFLRAAAGVSQAGSGEFGEYLLRDPGVQQECQTILGSLSPDERTVLIQLVKGQPMPDRSVLYSLYKKHLITHPDAGEPEIRLPLLAQYLSRLE